MISHVMDIFVKQGLKDFIILTGYKSDVVEYYFKSHKKKYSDLKINCFFTGVKTYTGKRLFLAKKASILKNALSNTCEIQKPQKD
jgi:glucose-1-phosphate cytidylyltransferase